MQIKPGLHRIQSLNQVIYALDCGRGYVLVDVGDEKELDNKLAALREDGIATERSSVISMSSQSLGRRSACFLICSAFSGVLGSVPM